eukprot:COSAG06_NODE_32906_length_498_cov_0.897243_1_plen_58_part_10
MPYGCIFVWIAGLAKKLRTAAREGDAAGVRACLEAGADPNAPNPEEGGMTAMHFAAYE